MGTYASVEDVAVDYGTISDDDTDRVEVLITRAEAQVAQRLPDLAARITAGRTDTGLVRQVVAEMVANYLRNPDGFGQSGRSVTNGPFSENTYGTRQAGQATGGLVITRRQIILLGGPRGAQSVPNGDTALARVLRRPPLGPAEVGEFGYRWPDPWVP